MSPGPRKPIKKKAGLTWPKPANKVANDLGASYKKSLRVITEELVRHEGLKTVDEIHVQAAHETLARYGLRRRRWFQRTELEFGGGTFFIGLAVAVPDLVSVFVKNEVYRKPWSVTLMVGCIIFSVILLAHSWFRGKL